MSRYETVTVTQVRASDGSLHKDRGAAEAHDRYRANQRKLEALVAAIEYGPFGPGLHDFCGDDFDGKPYEKDRRLEEIAELIQARWAQLRAVMETTP